MYVTLYKVFFPSHDGRRAAWTAFSLALGPSGSSSSPLGCWFNCTLWSLFQEDRVSFINHWMWTWTFIYVSACQWCWFWRLAGSFRVGELSCMSCCFPLLKKKRHMKWKTLRFCFVSAGFATWGEAAEEQSGGAGRREGPVREETTRHEGTPERRTASMLVTCGVFHFLSVLQIPDICRRKIWKKNSCRVNKVISDL